MRRPGKVRDDFSRINCLVCPCGDKNIRIKTDFKQVPFTFIVEPKKFSKSNGEYMGQQRLCVYSGLVFMVLFLLGWCLMAGFFPPPSPELSAVEISSFYADNTMMIRAGLLLTMASCGFYIPFVASISSQIKRIKHAPSVLADIQSLSGTAGMFVFLLPVMIWLTATFRPDRNPELILVLNDLGWLLFAMTFAPFLSQLLAIVFAVLADKQQNPVYPKWVGYLNAWVVASFIPPGLVVFFKTGPFAWDGVIGIWLPTAVP